MGIADDFICILNKAGNLETMVRCIM